MTELGRTLAAAASDLRELGAPFALVGGLAVSVRTEPRFTRDADLAVAVDDDAGAESLVFRLGQRGYEVVAAVEHGRVGRLATIRLVRKPAGSPTIVDLLFASSGIEREVVEAAETLDVLPAVRLRVARTGHLIALKLLSRDDASRPTDAADLNALGAVAEPSDWEDALQAVELITARGYHRDRDLVGGLNDLRGQASKD